MNIDIKEKELHTVIAFNLVSGEYIMGVATHEDDNYLVIMNPLVRDPFCCGDDAHFNRYNTLSARSIFNKSNIVGYDADINSNTLNLYINYVKTICKQVDPMMDGLILDRYNEMTIPNYTTIEHSYLN